MGRWSYSNRLVADSQHMVSIYWLRKHDCLKAYWSGPLEWKRRGEKTGSIGVEIHMEDAEKYARLYYTVTKRTSGKIEDFDYKIPILATKCFFGGVRYWFKCPMYKNGIYCGKRVAKLYQGGDYFACRHCYNLTYTSRNENPAYRHFPLSGLTLYSKIDRIRETMKKITYMGKPTKKMQRIIRLKNKTGSISNSFNNCLYRS